jgi:lambda repressor-like predicted transcriptional regulator
MLASDLAPQRQADATTPHVHKLAQRLPEEKLVALQDAYRDGTSLADLQQQFHLSRGSGQRVLRRAGVRRRRESLNDDETTVLMERYRAGLTIREIAAEQGLPKTTVQDALTRAGAMMRPAARRITRRKG